VIREGLEEKFFGRLTDSNLLLCERETTWSLNCMMYMSSSARLANFRLNEL
jgi:hypothetical protein